MTTVFNKIHRLKRQPGWTWERFHEEIARLYPGGIDEKTLYSHYRQPHKKPNHHLTKIIDQLHLAVFPDPFPEEINRLMRLYNNLVNNTQHASKVHDIQDLEYYLIDQLTRENEQSLLRIARINWLLGNMQFDRIPYYRDNNHPQQLAITKQLAIEYYQQSVSAIESYNRQADNQPVGPPHLYKARHNILASYLNAVPQEHRSHAPSILHYLRESNYISNSKETLRAEPFQWSIARNGLRFSSLLQNREDVEYFFNALLAVSDRFADLHYQPLNHGSLADGTDFQWMIQSVLTAENIKAMQQENIKSRKRSK